MKTNEEKAAEFPTKYGQTQKAEPKTPILGLTVGMSETTIQLRFAGYKDGLQKAALVEMGGVTQRIGKLVHAADQERHQKVLKSGDERQRALTEEEKRYQADLRAVQGRHTAAKAEIERHHATALDTSRHTFERQVGPLNLETQNERGRIAGDLAEKAAAAKAEMDPAMEVAKASRLAAEAERKAKAASLAEAAKADEDVLAGATDEELAAAAAVEAGAGA